jgi:hypothetical protein
MFIDPKNAKETLKKLRDAKGRFVGKDTPLGQTTTTTAKSTGAAAITEDALEDPSSDEPLVAFKINNPFRKLLEWIKEIKRKQTTTFEFQVKVPLLALPVFLVVLGSAFTFFFNQNHQANTTTSIAPTPTISKITPTPSPIYVSKIGTVKATYQVLSAVTKAYAEEIPIQPSPTPTSIPTPTSTPTPTITPTPTPPPSKYVLLDKDEHIIYLLTSKEISLQKYLNKRVVIKGWYLANKETLEIRSSQDIELLP